jgi:two-component system LytT family response regulator
MPIRVLLSDDEALARERLRNLLDDEPDVEIVAECGDGKSAISVIKREKPDLVFLDIQMPEIDGFGVVTALREHATGSPTSPDVGLGGAWMPLTIFVTAYDRYAMKAFEVHAVDYLLKPVAKERLSEALDHARKQLQNPSEATFQRRVLNLLSDLDSRQTPPQRIVIKADGEIVCLKPQEIDWAESAGNYVCLHVGPATHILRETITSLESRLGHHQFLRVHRSTLVNVDRIKTLRPSLYGDYSILLRDGTKLTLSRGFRENVLKRLGTA